MAVASQETLQTNKTIEVIVATTSTFHPVRKLFVAILLLKLKTFYSTCAIEIGNKMAKRIMLPVRQPSTAGRSSFKRIPRGSLNLKRVLPISHDDTRST